MGIPARTKKGAEIFFLFPALLSSFVQHYQTASIISQIQRIVMLRLWGTPLFLLFGILVGHQCFSIWGWEHYTGELLVFSHFRHETMQECLFVQSRGLTLDSRCRTDVLSWLVPLLGTVSITSGEDIATMLHICSLLFQTIMVAVVLGSTMVSFIQEKKLDLYWRTKSELFALYYFVHPITFFACNVSMVPSLFHFLILLLITSAIRGWRMAAVISLTLLVIGNSTFFCVVPATLCCLTYHGHPPMKKADEKKQTQPLSLPSIIVISTLLLFTSFVIHSYFTGDGYWSNHMGINVDDGQYLPSPGVFWYMDMETFPRFRKYFALLLYCPPYILCIPIITRLSTRPVHALSLTMAIVMYFRRETSFSDVVFIIALIMSLHAETIFNNTVMKAVVSTNLPHLPREQVLDPLQGVEEKDKSSIGIDKNINDNEMQSTVQIITQHNADNEKTGRNDERKTSESGESKMSTSVIAGTSNTPTDTLQPTSIINTATNNDTTPTNKKNTSVVGMRFLPLITLGITVPMVVSETMLKLWTAIGNGNANYLFFQGLVMWVFLATALIEFTNATIRELDD